MKTYFGLTRNVLALGVVSLLMDVSSEMIYPLIPLFLSDVLHASKTSIGLIEGVAESTASILKVFSGWLSDKLGKRKLIIFLGYGVSVVSRPVLGVAASWVHVLLYRFTDRVGKGVRTAPRDAIIADSTDAGVLGRAFGFHRSMDNVGAAIGPVLAFLLLGLTGGTYRWLFWISIIPGLFALLSIALLVQDVEKRGTAQERVVSLRGTGREFKMFLVVVTLFTLGKTSEVFLVLRAQEMGIVVSLIPLVYLTCNIVSAALSTPAGIFADRFGKRNTILLSYLLFCLVFIGFALATDQYYAWLLFAGYGLFVALNEGIQRAYVATVAKPDMMATSYGVYHAVIGLAALPSGIIGGALWQHLGSQAMFLYGAGMALFSSLLFMLLVPLRKS